MTGAVDELEDVRRKIDEVIVGMIKRAAVEKYTQDQLAGAYITALRESLPPGFRINPSSGPLWEWLFGFKDSAKNYLRRGDPTTRLRPITLRHVRAIKDTLQSLRVCVEAPELSANISSWDVFLDYVLLSIAKPPPLFHVPFGEPPHFMGRDDEFKQIDAALRLGDGCVAITALHGMRGVGKTVLAAAYAHRRRTDYRAIWWIDAQTDRSIRADLISLGVRLRWIGADAGEESALEVLEKFLHTADSILLIFDNAIDADRLRLYLPKGGTSKVLITSNFHAWGEVATQVKIDVWPRDVGADYLIARSGHKAEREAAETLSETLGGLPLAHAQAAAYCEFLGTSFAKYQQIFDAARMKLLEDPRYAPFDYYDRRPVTLTFTLAIEEAAKLHPAVEPLIVHAALLAPEAIPLFLFAEARERFAEPLASALADDGLDEAVAALRTFALVDREVIVDDRDLSITTDAIRLHRLVREIAAARCVGEARDQLQRILAAALVVVYPEDGYENPGSWPRCAPLTPHVLANCEAEVADPVLRAQLLNRAGGFLHGRAAYSRAEPLYRRALTIDEKSYGPDHTNVANSLSNLATLLGDTNRLSEAEPLYRRALAICEKSCGPDHPNIAIHLNNLATLLGETNRLHEAEPLHRRALAIDEKSYGPDHPSVAIRLNNLATLLRETNQLSEAEPLFRRALTIDEKSYGPEHPSVATCLNNLAGLLQATNRPSEAESLHRRALTIDEKCGGPDHPNVAACLNNLAGLLQATNRLSEAEPLYRRALTIDDKSYGPEHPSVARDLNNLAGLFRATNRLSEAEPLYRRALAIDEKSYGPDHPNVARDLNNLATLLWATQRLSEAEPLHRRALAICERSLGGDHPSTVTIRNNLLIQRPKKSRWRLW